MKNFLNEKQWIIWTTSVAVFCSSLVSFAYSQFVTKEEKASIERRLERIEDKIDRLLNEKV